MENICGDLKNIDLWNQFYQSDTEMIVTKTGRRMFPTISIDLKNLDPNLYYIIALEMAQIGNNRYKYSNNTGWQVAGRSDEMSLFDEYKYYIHPDSPNNGSFWMTQTLSFSRLKLTNLRTLKPNQIVLTSMHKYQPRIWIFQTSKREHLSIAPYKLLVFPETQFIAVTAYQNEKVTALKIESNPFAKGFRQNGKSYKKKKKSEDYDMNNNILIEDEQKETDAVSEDRVSFCDEEVLSSSPLSPLINSSPVLKANDFKMFVNYPHYLDLCYDILCNHFHDAYQLTLNSLI